jgi:hypothetical protein
VAVGFLLTRTGERKRTKRGEETVIKVRRKEDLEAAED